MPLATSVRPLCVDMMIGMLAPSSRSAFPVATTCAVVPPTRMTSGCCRTSVRTSLTTETGLASTHCTSRNDETVGIGLGEFLYALDLIDKSRRSLGTDRADRQLAAL